MTDIDLRGFRVALVADELINDGGTSFDVLGALDEAGWGVVLLPPAWYPDATAGPLLDAIADQLHEYHRHGYAVALVGEREGLDAVLARAGLPVPAAVPATTASELEAGLAAVASALAPHDAAAAQRGISRAQARP